METYDIAVIGGGCAGASAAMYGARFNLKTIMFAEQPGGLITTTHLVENYPGIKSISGPDMGMAFIEHAQVSGAELNFSRVNQVSKDGDYFKLQTGGGDFMAKTVVLATGTKHKELGIPGEHEYANKGVSYCALCDAGFFKEKTVAVIGGGDSSAIEANILSQHAAKVYVLVRKDFMRAEPVNLERIEKDPKVEIKYLTEAAEVIGDGEKMTAIKLKDGSELACDGMFIAIGWNPQNEIAKQVGAELDARGDVIIDREARTNVPGFYAAGDVTNAEFKQAIIGASEGVYAAVMAYHYIQEKFV